LGLERAFGLLLLYTFSVSINGAYDHRVGVQCFAYPKDGRGVLHPWLRIEDIDVCLVTSDLDRITLEEWGELPILP
jgi:hypothetical protein